MQQAPLPRSVSTELALAALLSRPHLLPAHVESITALMPSANLEVLQQLVRHHRIWPCVHCNLQAHFPELLKHPALSFLPKKYRQNARLAQRTFELSGTLLRKLKASAVQARVIKGNPVAHRLYGDITKRHAHDLDLVIPSRSLTTAHSILMAEGFTCAQFDALSETQKPLYLVAHKDIIYKNGRGILIELHLRLLAFETELTEHYLKTLFAEYSHTDKQAAELIYLCWHGSHSLFHRLKWLVDIALYLEQIRPEEVKVLIELASNVHAMRILTVCWMLAHRLFATEIPMQICDFHDRDLASRILVARCLKQLNHPKPIESLRFKLERFCCEPLLYQNTSEKLASLIYKLKPTALDFGTIENIPPQLSFVYYLARPFLFLYRRFANKP